MRWMLAVPLCLTAAARAEILASDCIAVAENDRHVIPVRYGVPTPEGVVRIRYSDHAMVAIETSGGLMAVTDYKGKIGTKDVVPEIVTMNNCHDTHCIHYTHYTDQPDRRMPLVIRGRRPMGCAAALRGYDGSGHDCRGGAQFASAYRAADELV